MCVYICCNTNFYHLMSLWLTSKCQGLWQKQTRVQISFCWTCCEHDVMILWYVTSLATFANQIIKFQDITVVAICPFCACHSFVQIFGLASYSLDYGSVLGLWCQGAGRGTQCICGECGSCSCRSPFMCARARTFTHIVYIHTPFFPFSPFFSSIALDCSCRILNPFSTPKLWVSSQFWTCPINWEKIFLP
jgi:hypothetical protein